MKNDGRAHPGGQSYKMNLTPYLRSEDLNEAGHGRPRQPARRLPRQATRERATEEARRMQAA